MTDYWKICIEEAFSEADIFASGKQVKIVVAAVEAGHEMHGEYTQPRNTGPSALESENLALKQKLDKELSKVGCEVCKGTGYLRWQSVSHEGKDDCHKCHGQGRY